MDENKKIMFIIGGVFLFAMGFQIFSTYIPSLMATTQNEKEIEANLSIEEKIKNDLQKALDTHIEKINKDDSKENSEDKKPSSIKARKVPNKFSEFVIYTGNNKQNELFNLNKYSENFIDNEPIKGLDSKTLVIKLKNEKTNQPKTTVFLLNQTLINMTEM